MGITKTNFFALHGYLKNVSEGSEIATLGRQKLILNHEQKKQISKYMNSDIAQTFGKSNFLDEMPLYKHIKFSAIDISNYEGADYVMDLNDEIPRELQSKFDGIIDYGTLEHIFNVSEAIKSVFAMLKRDGMYHYCLPNTGCNNHGYYQFSSFFFPDLVATNRNTLRQINQYLIHERKEYIFTTFEQLCDVRRLEWNSLEQIGILGTIQKLQDTAINLHVYQTDYLEDWEEADDSNQSAEHAYGAGIEPGIRKIDHKNKTIRRILKLHYRLRQYGLSQTIKLYSLFLLYKYNLPKQDMAVRALKLRKLHWISEHFK